MIDFENIKIKFTNEYDLKGEITKTYGHFIDPRTEKKRKVSVKWSSKNLRTEKAARRLLSAKIYKIVEEETPINKKGIQNFGQLKQLWLESWASTVKPQTKRLVEVTLRATMPRFIADDVSLNNISPLFIQDRWNKFSNSEKGMLTNQPLSSNTLAQIRNYTKQIFTFGVVYEVIEKSPMSELKLKIPKQKIEQAFEKSKLKFLEDNEIDWALEVIKEVATKKSMGGLVYLDTTLFLLHTGLRIGELGALVPSDVNFEDRTLSISRNLTTQGLKRKDFYTGSTKTQTSTRVIQLDEMCIKILENRIKKNLDRQEFVKAFRNEKNNPSQGEFNNFIFSDNIFQNKFGTPFTTHMYSLFINYKRGKQRRNIDDIIKSRHPEYNKHISSHIFRHTHISMLAERGWNIKEIMDRVGHKKSDTTLEVYQQVTKNMLKNQKNDLKDFEIGKKYM